MTQRNAYYNHLESAQKGSLDIIPWLLWFLDTLKEVLEQALLIIDRVVMKDTFRSNMPRWS
jgi:Fic family protein